MWQLLMARLIASLEAKVKKPEMSAVIEKVTQKSSVRQRTAKKVHS